MPKTPSDWINFRQSKAERRAKYSLALKLGYKSSWARALRDVSWSALERHNSETVQALGISMEEAKTW